MKKLLTILLLAPIFVNPQNKIDGIGQFKINKTTLKDIEQFADGLKLEMKSSDQILDFSSEAGNTTKILYVAANSDDFLTSPYAPILKNEKVIYIDNLHIAGIIIQDVYMNFWNDTLYKIESNGSDELIEAIKLKYGNPVTTKKERLLQCRSGAGVLYNEKAVTYTSKWVGLSNIQGINVVGKNFDLNCKAMFSSTFQVLNSSKDNKVRALASQYLTKKKNEDDKAKKSKLNDL